MERFVDFGKGDFIGREALLRQKEAGVGRKLACLVIETVDADVHGFEPIFAEHYEARCEVETEMLFLGSGAVTYFKPDGSVDYVFDAETLIALVEGGVTLDIGGEAASAS